MLSPVLFVVFFLTLFKFSSLNVPVTELKRPYPRDCSDIKERYFSKFHTIKPEYAEEPFAVLCDFKNPKTHWTYILNRFTGNQSFFRDWDSYVNGFGHLAGDFWLGLEKIYQLTGHEINELSVELVDWRNRVATVTYAGFMIAGKDTDYTIKLLTGAHGDAGDSLYDQSGLKFSTIDRDNDMYNGNCADEINAGWWFRNCTRGLPTGTYYPRDAPFGKRYKCIYWRTWHRKQCLQKVSMKVRPRPPYRSLYKRPYFKKLVSFPKTTPRN